MNIKLDNLNQLIGARIRLEREARHWSLSDLAEQAGASVVGAGIAIEKAFQGGGDRMRAEGMRVESLAKIASMSDDGLVFCR